MVTRVQKYKKKDALWLKHIKILRIVHTDWIQWYSRGWSLRCKNNITSHAAGTIIVQWALGPHTKKRWATRGARVETKDFIRAQVTGWLRKEQSINLLTVSMWKNYHRSVFLVMISKDESRKCYELNALPVDTHHEIIWCRFRHRRGTDEREREREKEVERERETPLVDPFADSQRREWKRVTQRHTYCRETWHLQQRRAETETLLNYCYTVRRSMVLLSVPRTRVRRSDVGVRLSQMECRAEQGESWQRL